MNIFEMKFFKKYVPSGQEIKLVVHKHSTDILGNIFLWLSIVIIPSFVYFYSGLFKIIIPFYIVEVTLIILYVKIIYNIFNWYADVWIITNKQIIDLRWSIWKSKMDNISFESIEGLGVEQDGWIDKVLMKGHLTVHKMGEDAFVLENVFRPYKTVGKIEAIIEEHTEEPEPEHKISQKSFEKVIHTLSGVIEEYLEKGGKIGEEEEEEDEKNEKIEVLKKKKGTIDLR